LKIGIVADLRPVPPSINAHSHYEEREISMTHFYTFKDLPQEFVTPKYSKAYGGLLAGEHIEVGWLSFGAGEGAVEHAHPHEQVMVVIKGRSTVAERAGSWGLAKPSWPRRTFRMGSRRLKIPK
jgi:mannose-6-phosphate isomerase-like protein (cupin superfamily)